jgi:hypothetical protein
VVLGVWIIRRMPQARAEHGTCQGLIASRARIVAAADEARRQIELDLHDGIQQQLISLGFALRMTRESPITSWPRRSPTGRSTPKPPSSSCPRGRRALSGWCRFPMMASEELTPQRGEARAPQAESAILWTRFQAVGSAWASSGHFSGGD